MFKVQVKVRSKIQKPCCQNRWICRGDAGKTADIQIQNAAPEFLHFRFGKVIFERAVPSLFYLCVFQL